MNNLKRLKENVRIQQDIISISQDKGIKAILGFIEQHWRTKVYIPQNDYPIPLEIELSAQSVIKDKKSRVVTPVGRIACI